MKTIYINYDRITEKLVVDDCSKWNENLSFNSIEFQYNYEKITCLYPSQLEFQIKKQLISQQYYQSSQHLEFLVIQLYSKRFNEEIYKVSFNSFISEFKGEYTTLIEFLGHGCARFYSVDKFESICFDNYLNNKDYAIEGIQKENIKFLFQACFGFYMDNGYESSLFLKETPWLEPYHFNSFFRSRRSRKIMNPTKIKKCVVKLNDILLNNKSEFLLNILERVYKYA